MFKPCVCKHLLLISSNTIEQSGLLHAAHSRGMRMPTDSTVCEWRLAVIDR